MTLKPHINIPDMWSSSLCFLYAMDISWIAMNTEIVTDVSFVLPSAMRITLTWAFLCEKSGQDIYVHVQLRLKVLLAWA